MKTKTFLLVIVCFCAGILAQAQIKLSFNPTVGEKYSYRFSTEQSIKQTVMGQNITTSITTTSITMEMLTEMNIKENSEDGIRVDYLYKEIVMKVSNPVMNIKYDSKNNIENLSETEKLLAQTLNALVGRTINAVFEFDGSVKSVSGFQAIMEDILEDIADSEDPTVQMAGNTFLQSFNEEALKNMFERSFKIYPDKAVKVGDRWNNNISSIVSGMTTDVKNEYKFKSVKNDIALLEVVSSLELKPDAAAGMEGKLSGKQKGTISLDVKTGMLINSTVTQDTKGSLSVQGMEILMDMATKIMVTLQQ